MNKYKVVLEKATVTGTQYRAGWVVAVDEAAAEKLANDLNQADGFVFSFIMSREIA